MRYTNLIHFVLLYCLLFMGADTVHAQKELNTWYFGINAGIDFNTVPPHALSDSKMTTIEGCSSISDKLGQMLFYTDGQTVWDRHHNPMLNGTGLFGNASSTHSSVIIKKPFSDSVYYVITADDWSINPNKGVCYSIVDLTLNNGNGDLSVKNVSLISQSAEKIAATIHRNGSYVWLAVPEGNSDKVHMFLLTENGLEEKPELHTIFDSGERNWGQIKFSPNSKLLALTYPVKLKSSSESIVSFASFDNLNGTVSNVHFVNGGTNLYGLEFSPNSRYLYLSKWLDVPRVCQCAIGNTDIDYINDCISLGTPGNVMSSGQMQLGPNGKIYITAGKFVDAINDPDSAGILSNYMDSAIAMSPGTSCFYGLPTFYNDYVNKNQIRANNLCFGDLSLIYTEYDTLLYDSAQWFVNDTLRAHPAFSFSQHFADTGYSAIRLVMFKNTFTDTFEKTIYINPAPLFHHAQQNIAICKDDSLLLDRYLPQGLNYQWSTGSKDSAIFVKDNGQYTVQISKESCSTWDTILVSTKPAIHTGLPDDTVFCQNSSAVISVSQNNARYLWSTGDTTQQIAIDHKGTYTVKVIFDQCIAYDTTIATGVEAPKVDLGNDTAVCSHIPYLLHATNPFSSYAWSNQSHDSVITATTDALYRVTVTNPCGIATDSVEITLKNCQCDLFMPNAFTPNEDQVNDIFLPHINCLTLVYRLRIYDRWGQLLFETSEPLKGWDGKLNGATCTSDTYIWSVTYSMAPPVGSGQVLFQKGTVTLLR